MEEKSQNILKITQKIINITPQTSYLSAIELTNLRNRDIPPITVGLKRTIVENTTEEANSLEKLYENMEKQLSRPRIERLAGRAVGIWDFEKNLVRVERKDGKFGNFGFNINGQMYLEYYEALFLLEVNRLQLEYNSIILSLEQAYLLLLGEQQSHKYHEYLVYSNLTRVGYILVKHQNIHFRTLQINSEFDCVWAILEAELQDEPLADYVKKMPYYATIKQKFDDGKNKIKNQTVTVENRNDNESENENEMKFHAKLNPSLKRKASEDIQNEWLAAKKHCNYASKVFQKSLVGFLKEEDEYKKFKDMFEKFDLVPLKSNDRKKQNEWTQTSESDTEDDEEEKDIHIKKLLINFDVYLHNEGFRKSSPHLPNFRVIVMQPNQRFPTHDEIFATHRLQLNPVPLLIVSVNESKQMQAFLYYFS